MEYNAKYGILKLDVGDTTRLRLVGIERVPINKWNFDTKVTVCMEDGTVCALNCGYDIRTKLGGSNQGRWFSISRLEPHYSRQGGNNYHIKWEDP